MNFSELEKLNIEVILLTFGLVSCLDSFDKIFSFSCSITSSLFSPLGNCWLIRSRNISSDFCPTSVATLQPKAALLNWNFVNLLHTGMSSFKIHLTDTWYLSRHTRSVNRRFSSSGFKRYNRLLNSSRSTSSTSPLT